MPLTFPNLFSKGKIGNLEVRNRVVMLPMSTNFPSENGVVTKELIDYYAERAKGGAGIIIVESAAVDYPRGKNGATKLRCDQVNFIPGLSRLADAVHLYGAKILLQMQHAGCSTSLEKTYGHQPVAPSDVTKNGEITARALSTEEIHKIIDDFVKTAKYCKEAGFDGVEVHAAHSYLIAEFLTPIFNKRTDEYGGDLNGRARILLEIVERIRREVGPKFIIAVRMNGDEFTEGGLNVEDAKKIAVLLEDATANLLDISTGLTQHSENLSMYWPQGWRVYLAKAIKQVVNIPVIAGGNIRDPQFAEEVLANGDADFIGLGRGLLADPYWPQKAAKGAPDRIRKCISCNVGCTERRISGVRSIKCSVNPDVGQEGASVAVAFGTKSKKVVVIGAGAGGLNAALEAKKRGHDVVVLEKGSDIGGLLHIAAVPFGKQALQSYVAYLHASLQEHDLKVLFNKEVTFESVSGLKPDVVVFATGSSSLVPASIPGIRNENVLTAHDVLRKTTTFKDKNLVIIGGGSIGCETADFLAEDNKVTIVEMLSELATDTEKMNRADLLKRLTKLGVTSVLETRLEAVHPDKVVVRSKGEVREIPADVVILAVGAVSALPEWAGKIAENGIDSFVIGDARMPGKLINAVSQGAAIGRMI